MYAARVVAKLNGKTQNFECGVEGDLSQKEIELGLAFMRSEGARLLARVKYAGQGIFYADLVETVLDKVWPIAVEENWAVTRFFLRKLCLTAVDEAVLPRFCRQCKGRGERKRRKLVVSCVYCFGNGLLSRSDRWRARSSQVDWWQWRKLWGQRYKKVILPILDGFEEDFWKGMRRQLR